MMKCNFILFLILYFQDIEFFMDIAIFFSIRPTAAETLRWNTIQSFELQKYPSRLGHTSRRKKIDFRLTSLISGGDRWQPNLTSTFAGHGHTPVQKNMKSIWNIWIHMGGRGFRERFCFDLRSPFFCFGQVFITFAKTKAGSFQQSQWEIIQPRSFLFQMF